MIEKEDMPPAITDAIIKYRYTSRAVDLLQKLVELCETKGTSSCRDYIRQLYLDPDALPSLWFDLHTDDLIAPVVVKIVSILNKKPFDSWESPDFFLLSEFMVLTCGPAVKEEIGSNEGVKRWLKVFSASLRFLPFELQPICLWLLTFLTPHHDTLFESALRTYDGHLIMLKGAQAWKFRNQSLRLLYSQLKAFNEACAFDLYMKMLKSEIGYDVCLRDLPLPEPIVMRKKGLINKIRWGFHNLVDMLFD